MARMEVTTSPASAARISRSERNRSATKPPSSRNPAWMTALSISRLRRPASSLMAARIVGIPGSRMCGSSPTAAIAKQAAISAWKAALSSHSSVMKAGSRFRRVSGDATTGDELTARW